MISIVKEAITFVAKIIYQKTIDKHLGNKIEYENIKDNLTDKINIIENGIKSLRIKDLMASLEYFKIALNIIKDKQCICRNVRKDLENARKLAITAYDTVSSIDDKLTTTKIIIATAILLFENDETVLKVNITSALERLLKNKIIQKTVACECRGDCEIDEKTKKALLLIPSETNKLSTHFLFWKRFGPIYSKTDSETNKIRTICVYNGKQLITGTSNSLTWYDYKDGKLSCFR